MLKIRSLPLTVEYHTGESATSVAARLARRNGAPRLITFCSDIGLDYFALANGEEIEVRRLAAFAGVDHDELVKNTPSVVRKDWFRLGEAEIKFSAFQRTRPRVCPICIEGCVAETESARHINRDQPNLLLHVFVADTAVFCRSCQGQPRTKIILTSRTWP
ncbi:TniQ family protein [Aliiroseovarius sp.]|uniref:TniQ family protein n=1 Tax=Aliiroseovarius sp. TaxID=1872442 RepID=UPI003BAC404A